MGFRRRPGYPALAARDDWCLDIPASANPLKRSVQFAIDIPACHSARNRTIISGNQVLCASPEGISPGSPRQQFSVLTVVIVIMPGAP
jgi:hypothetical protein